MMAYTLNDKRSVHTFTLHADVHQQDPYIHTKNVGHSFIAAIITLRMVVRLRTQNFRILYYTIYYTHTVYMCTYIYPYIQPTPART